MKKSNRRQRELEQKRIAVLFCSIVAVVMICSILFGTINTQAAPAEVTTKYYTSIQIKSGDTLWEIAGKYMTNEYKDRKEYMKEVCSINHISADEIHAGQFLVIPYYSE